jgi:two-component system sensor histidine kinase ResE
MEKIVNDLLFLFRADAGKIQFQNENVDLNRLIRKTLPGIKKLAAAKHISLNFDTGNSPLIYRIDPDKFRQVVTNVLDNAIKYTPENGRVDIRLLREQGSLIVTVTDNGIGIPEEEIPFVFDRFYRVDKARSYDQNSSGLGLSICKWIVEAYGGRIEIDSAVNSGTEVRIFLPENKG